MEKRVFKKGRNLAGGTTKFRGWSKWSAGDEVVLRYLDQKQDNYGKPSYRCECLDAKFHDEDSAPYIGGNMTLNSTGMLDKAMQDIAPGQLFMVTYNGKAKIMKGPYAGKESHTMDIDLVEEEGVPAPLTGVDKPMGRVNTSVGPTPITEPSEDEEDFF